MVLRVFLVAFLVQFGSSTDPTNLSLKAGEEVTITNVNFPAYDKEGTELTWNVEGPANGGLRLKCPTLDISQTENCVKGFIVFDDGKSQDKRCGYHPRMTAASVSNKFTIHFKLDWAAGYFKCVIEGLEKPTSDVKEYRVHVKPNDGPIMDLGSNPFSMQEKTDWILTTDGDSKIEVSCSIKIDSHYPDHVKPGCNVGSVTFVLDNEEKQFCGSEENVKFSGSRIVIKVRTGSMIDGHLNCMAVELSEGNKWFKDIPSEEVDSSEYGMKSGKDKPTCDCGRANKGPKKRVIYGKNAEENEFPWAVSLQLREYDFHFCGGSIVTQRHVISCAHCTEKKSADEVGILVGATHLERSKHRKMYRVKRIINHDYQPNPTRRDISILVTKEKIKFTREVSPICIPREDPRMVGKYITAVGWGRMAKDESHRDQKHLQKTHMRIVDPKQCRTIWHDHHDENLSQICTWSNHTDICLGDSGGPIVWLDEATNRYFLVGLPSLCDGCRLTMPSIHTAVHYYYQWILDNISDNGRKNRRHNSSGSSESKENRQKRNKDGVCTKKN